MLKGYSFLLYLLAFLVFFFVGLSFAGLIEAGKGQMLAGGAIVLGYGVMGSVLGLILALFTANKASRKTMIRLNIILAVSLIAFWSFYAIKFQKRQQERQESNQPKTQQPKKTIPTKPVDGLQFGGSFSNISSTSSDVISSEKYKYQSMGLGLFGPDITENSVLYFYGNINPEKPLDEHMPYDSITFNRDQYNNISIATAPPWLNPQHLKLDYGILLFKVKTALREFVEVEVNVANQQTTYVSTYAGQISYWPDFLLKVHSIELLSPDSQVVKIKPLDHADEIILSYETMQPIAIRQDWIKVALMDNNYKKLGEGWVKWQDNGRLLISYSLLS